jgi:hypothetical protein
MRKRDLTYHNDVWGRVLKCKTLKSAHAIIAVARWASGAHTCFGCGFIPSSWVFFDKRCSRCPVFRAVLLAQEYENAQHHPCDYYGTPWFFHIKVLREDKSVQRKALRSMKRYAKALVYTDLSWIKVK